MNNARQLAPLPTTQGARLRVVASTGAQAKRKAQGNSSRLPALSRPNRGLHVVERGTGSQALARAFAAVADVRTLPAHNIYLDHDTLAQAHQIVAQVEREIATRAQRERALSRRAGIHVPSTRTGSSAARKISVRAVVNGVAEWFGFQGPAVRVLDRA